MHRIIAPLILIVAICGTLMSPGEPAAAQDAVLEKLYGTGVHAFYAGDYLRAHKYFTMAIDAGSKDPRPYYFRGLAYMRLGRQDEAEMDFTTGADLEMADINQFFPVAASLARIQGGSRVMLEQRRTDARLASYQRAVTERNIRFGNNPGGGETVPRPTPVDPAPIDPAEGNLFPEEPTDPMDGGPGIVDPFKKPGPIDPPVDPTPIDPPPVDPVVPNPFDPATPTDPTDPFSDPDPAPVDPTDPFGGPDPAPVDPADPFGGPDPAPVDPIDPVDPFGTKPEVPGDRPPVGPGPDRDPTLTDPEGIDTGKAAGNIGRALLRGFFGGGGEDKPAPAPGQGNPFGDDKDQPAPVDPPAVNPDPFGAVPAVDPPAPDPFDADPFR